jgi:glutathione synthase/RimK-type ligase-like ATP-grasp enzyme
MSTTPLTRPIGILDEHPDWSARLTAELTQRGLPWERIDHSNHRFDPHETRRVYSVIVNRTSPSSHTRGHTSVLFYAEALLAHLESVGTPVVNPVAAYRFEKSKALQLGLCARLGVRYPPALVVNHRDQVLKALDHLRFPLVIKPNVGGSGAGIVRVATREQVEQRLDTIGFGPDGTALVQEYIEPAEGAIVRVEVLDGQYLYAIRIVRVAEAGFNLCPADLCQGPSATPPAGLGACAGEGKPELQVSRVDPPPEAVETAIRLLRAAAIDVGGVEYLVSQADGQIYYYDINATSNFVANAPAVVGFDPTARFADYIVRVAHQAGGRPVPPGAPRWVEAGRTHA